MKIAVVAPSCTLDSSIPSRIAALLPTGFEIDFHPQCFLNDGHFAGTDAARTAALVEVANDRSYDAVWFARGGYGACRVATPALEKMDKVAARAKI